MRNLLSILFIIFSFAVSAQTIKQKQVKDLQDTLNAIRSSVGKADTADVIGIVKSGTVDNVDSLRATDLYAKGFTLMFTRGFATLNDGGGSRYVWNPTSTATDDSKFVFKPNNISSGSAGRWEWQTKGVVRASEVGVKSDGTDQTSTLNALFSLSTVKEVVFDNSTVKITGKVDAQSKKVRFENSGKIIGNSSSNSDTLANAYIMADLTTQIFDTSLNVINCNSPSRIISLIWFGGKGDYVNDSNRGTDNSVPFQRAANALYNSLTDEPTRPITGTIYIPGGKYFASQTSVISTIMTVTGAEGTYRLYSTKWYVPNNVTAFKLVHPGAQGAVIQYLDINASGTRGTDRHVHGIDCNTVASIRYNSVNDFSGIGINVAADVNWGVQNSSMTIIERNFTSYNDVGIWITGGDANIIRCVANEAIANYSKGICETAFLGNYLEGNHIAFTGAVSGQQICASYGGVNYICYKDSTINHPPSDVNYWYQGDLVGITPPVYDSTKYYMAGAAYYVTGTSAATTLVNDYSESGQPKSISATRAIVIGGIYGSGWLDMNSQGYYDMSINTLSGNYDWKTGLNIRIPSALQDIDINSSGLTAIPRNGVASLGMYYGYNSYRKWLGWRYSSDDRQPLSFPTDSTSAAIFGRTTALTTGFYTAQLNPMISIDGSVEYRLLKFGTAAPTTGNYATGDFFINSGSDTTTLGFKCISGGTPGTWKAIKTGNGATAGGSSTIAGQGDANISSPANGDVLTYQTSDNKWHNLPPTAAGVAGSNTQVQFNNSSAFGASANFTWNNSTNLLAASNISANVGYVNATTDYRLAGSTIFDIYNPGTGNELRWNSGGGYGVYAILNANVVVGNTSSAGNYKLQNYGNGITVGYNDLAEIAKPSSAPTNYIRLYGKSDHKLYAQTSGGIEYDLTAGTNTVDSIWRTAGKDSIQFSISGRYHAIKDSTSGSQVKTLSSQYTDAANSGTTETDLMSYTLPASQLANNGDRIVIEAIFTTPSNADNKTLRFYFGLYSQVWTPSSIATGATVHVRVTIIKTGASTQKIAIEYTTGYSDYPVFSTSSETDTGTIAMKFTGQSNTASSDIIQRLMTVTYYPN